MAPCRVIMVVEDVDVARTALQWAVDNIIRGGDLVTLLHVFEPSSSSMSSGEVQKKKKKSKSSIAAASHRQRVRRLKGFQLALSFKDICAKIPEVKVEIIVTEGDLGQTISSLVTNIGASTVILGLHDQSFLYKTGVVDDYISSLKCRVLAVKQPSSSVAMPDFSRIELVRNRTSEPKSPLHGLPNPIGSFWRSRK
ncbi:hypothetical protein EJ110_NYTH33235 [Nymphaea thermarum]|nr:hypothetical protein EJ110_NYTH33235 [Nymphaea thermarum]